MEGKKLAKIFYQHKPVTLKVYFSNRIPHFIISTRLFLKLQMNQFKRNKLCPLYFKVVRTKLVRTLKSVWCCFRKPESTEKQQHHHLLDLESKNAVWRFFSVSWKTPDFSCLPSPSSIFINHSPSSHRNLSNMIAYIYTRSTSLNLG